MSIEAPGSESPDQDQDQQFSIPPEEFEGAFSYNALKLYHLAREAGPYERNLAKRDIAIRISTIRAEVEEALERSQKFRHVDLAEVEMYLQEFCEKQIDLGTGKVLQTAIKDEREGDDYKRLHHELFSRFWDRVRYLPRRARRREEALRRHLTASVESTWDEIAYKDDLRQAVDTLPKELRKVIMLKFFNRLTVSDIMQTLQWSENKVARRLREAIEVLHAKMTA